MQILLCGTFNLFHTIGLFLYALEGGIESITWPEIGQKPCEQMKMSVMVCFHLQQNQNVKNDKMVQS